MLLLLLLLLLLQQMETDMDIKELKSILLNKIAELTKEANASNIASLASAYETMRKSEAPDPYKSMAKVFSSALTFKPAVETKGEKDDNGRKKEIV